MEIEACLYPFFIFTNENVRFDILTLLAYFIISIELKPRQIEGSKSTSKWHVLNHFNKINCVKKSDLVRNKIPTFGQTSRSS